MSEDSLLIRIMASDLVSGPVAAARASIRDLGAEADAAGKGGLRSMDSELSGVRGHLAGMVTDLAKVGAGLATFGAIGLGESIKQATTFESSMTRLTTQAGVTTQTVAQLTPQILSMAGQVGFGPNSLAEALYHVESANAGLGKSASSTANVLESVRLAAEGARVGNADLTDVTNALVGVLTSGIGGIHGAADAMGQLNSIVGAGNMTMSQLVSALGSDLLPTAANFGLTLQDVGGALATLTDNSTPATVAATRLRTTFQLAASPSEAAAKALGVLGLSQYALATDLRKPDGLAVAMTDLSTHMQEYSTSHVPGVIAAEDELSAAFGRSRSAAGVETLVRELGRLQDKTDSLNVDNGAQRFAAAWAATQKTTAQRVHDIEGSFDSLMVHIGTAALPSVDRLLGPVSGGLQDLQGLFDTQASTGYDRAESGGGQQASQFSNFMAQMRGDFTQTRAAIAPLTSAVGQFFTDSLTAGEKLWHFLDGDMTPVWSTLAKVLGGTVVVAFDAADDVVSFFTDHTNVLKGTLAALATVMAVRTFSDFAGWISNSAQAMNDYAAKAAAGKLASQEAAGNIGNLGGNIRSLGGNAFDAGRNLLSTFIPGLNGTAGPLQQTEDETLDLNTVLDELNTTLQSLVTTLGGSLSPALQETEGQMSLFASEAQTASETASTSLTQAMGSPVIGSVRAGSGAIVGAIGGITAAIGSYEVGSATAGHGTGGLLSATLTGALSGAAAGLLTFDPAGVLVGATVGGLSAIAGHFFGHKDSVASSVDQATQAIQTFSTTLAGSYQQDGFKTGGNVKTELTNMLQNDKGLNGTLMATAGLNTGDIINDLNLGHLNTTTLDKLHDAMQKGIITPEQSTTIQVSLQQMTAQFESMQTSLQTIQALNGNAAAAASLAAAAASQNSANGSTSSGTTPGLSSLLAPVAPNTTSTLTVPKPLVAPAPMAATPGALPKALGGWVPGAGNTDSVPIMAMPGEFVVRKTVASTYGGMLSRLNAGGGATGLPGHYATGGFVTTGVPAAMAPSSTGVPAVNVAEGGIVIQVTEAVNDPTDVVAAVSAGIARYQREYRERR